MALNNILPSNDGRRIAGPEKSLPYSVFMDKTSEDIVTNKRSEGRTDGDHRKIFLSTGVMNKAKGSAYIEQGGTKIIVGVFGPKEVQKRSDFSVTGSLTAEFKFAPFACHKRRVGGQQDREAEELSLVVGEALSSTVCLNKYPKSVIEVGITVIEDDGGVVAAALTAAGLALADAGIHMFDLVVGVKVGLIQKKDGDVKVLVDPDKREEDVGPGELTLGYLPSLEQVVCCLCQGVMTSSTMSRGLASATETAALVLPAVQQELVTKLKQTRAKENQK